MSIEKNIQMSQFNGTDYDNLNPKTKAGLVTVSDTVAAELGVGVGASVDETFGRMPLFVDGIIKKNTGFVNNQNKHKFEIITSDLLMPIETRAIYNNYEIKNNSFQTLNYSVVFTNDNNQVVANILGKDGTYSYINIGYCNSSELLRFFAIPETDEMLIWSSDSSSKNQLYKINVQNKQNRHIKALTSNYRSILFGDKDYCVIESYVPSKERRLYLKILNNSTLSISEYTSVINEEAANVIAAGGGYAIIRESNYAATGERVRIKIKRINLSTGAVETIADRSATQNSFRIFCLYDKIDNTFRFIESNGTNYLTLFTYPSTSEKTIEGSPTFEQSTYCSGLPVYDHDAGFFLYADNKYQVISRDFTSTSILNESGYLSPIYNGKAIIDRRLINCNTFETIKRMAVINQTRGAIFNAEYILISNYNTSASQVNGIYKFNIKSVELLAAKEII